MLGEIIIDFDVVEFWIEFIKGLGLFLVEMVMIISKKIERVVGYVQLESERVLIEGYEIYMGKMIFKSIMEVFVVVEYEKEGMVKDNVIGMYVYDVFYNDVLCRVLFN